VVDVRAVTFARDLMLHAALSTVTMREGSAPLPKAVVFDLDGCLWAPDMYMLWGGGAPFTKNEDGSLTDKIGQRVCMLGAVPEVLLELKTDQAWQETVVAVASCTDEPSWADECLRLFDVGGGHSIKDCIDREEIYKANKQRHLKTLSETLGIALEDMLFFDNEWGNIADVSSIGVSCAYVPDGVTRDAWELALSRFPSVGEVIDAR
jgi:magnesium-dependent phosphatase 1